MNEDHHRCCCCFRRCRRSSRLSHPTTTTTTTFPAGPSSPSFPCLTAATTKPSSLSTFLVFLLLTVLTIHAQPDQDPADHQDPAEEQDQQDHSGLYFLDEYFQEYRPPPPSSSSSHRDDGSTDNDEFVFVTLPGLGRIRGRNDHEYDCHFFGAIPYAEAPVGAGRWAPPTPLQQPWGPTTTLDATQYPPDCHQVVDPLLNPLADASKMSEDCLYLNVFRPASSSSTTSSLLPVLVWFHGGAFQQGASRRPEYDARRMASRHDVVVVTVNYRLGALGFLVSRLLGLNGNYGLMDQRAALHFVKHNVRYLSGDPNSITLFGESAGAVMIGLHLQMNNNVDDEMSDVGVGVAGVNEDEDGVDDSNDRRLFHKAILQSNPLGYQFRSVVVADFLGDALRRAVDCRDLDCMRSEPVEDLLRAQSSLMGIPRSVGDFFAWGPTLTMSHSITSAYSGFPPSSSNIGSIMTSSSSTSSSTSTMPHGHVQLEGKSLFSTNVNNNHDDDGEDEFVAMRETVYQQQQRMQQQQQHRSSSTSSSSSSSPFAVNVTQPLLNLDRVPDDIPIIIGTNVHEGEMFVHGAFPLAMNKAVYWMFVGALFKDSAPKVLKHYRPYVQQLEAQAEALAARQMREEEAKQFIVEHQTELELEYEQLLERNSSTSTVRSGGASAWKGRGGADEEDVTDPSERADDIGNDSWNHRLHRLQSRVESLHRGVQSLGGHVHGWTNRTKERFFPTPTEEEVLQKQRERLEEAKRRAKERALKEAAKVVIDYRPVMSRIIGDYLFRCPSWHYAHLLSLHRIQKAQKRRFCSQQGLQNATEDGCGDDDNNDLDHSNNVFVYRFSHPTHVPGFFECWGKSCHTSELPFVFEAMEIIRSDYSTLSPVAQDEAPVAPEYPYTDLLAAYQGKTSFQDDKSWGDVDVESTTNATTTTAPTTNSNKNNKKEMTTNTRQRITQSFQRILKHVLGDAWDPRDDADERVAADMTARWVAFARTGNPNYHHSAAESSGVEWMPWRYVPKDDQEDGDGSNFMKENPDLWTDRNSFDHYLPWDQRQLYQVWHDLVERQGRDDLDENPGDLSEEERQAALGEAYRLRALQVMSMEVVEDDALRTELRRIVKSDNALSTEHPFAALGLLTTSTTSSNYGGKQDTMKAAAAVAAGNPNIPHHMIQRIQRMAQDMGVLGSGLRGDEQWLLQGNGGVAGSGSGSRMGIRYDARRQSYWDDAFFPQLLELKWPPEGRLVERDCTCDFWERIRYRY